MLPVMEFLAAYYPRYVCPPCLAKLMGEEEATVQTSLLATTPGLQFESTDCLDCGVKTVAVRYKAA